MVSAFNAIEMLRPVAGGVKIDAQQWEVTMAGNEVLMGHLTTLETMIGQLYAMMVARQPDAEGFIERNRDRQIDTINAADGWPLEAQVAGEECAKRVATLALGNLAQLRGSGG